MEYLYPLLFYRRVKPEAAVNWVLVKVNRSSGLKVVKKKGNCGQQTDLVVGCYWLCCWSWKSLVLLHWSRRVGVVSVSRVARGWPVVSVRRVARGWPLVSVRRVARGWPVVSVSRVARG